MSVLYAENIEILFPIRKFLLERDRAETGLNPANRSVLQPTGVFHVVQVFVACHRPCSKISAADCTEKALFLALKHLCLDEVAHR